MTASQPLAAQLRVILSHDLFAKYQQEAEDYGVEIEELLANRLRECQTYNATTPLYFNDDQRRELEKILGKNLRSSGEAMGMVRRLNEVKINGIAISFPPLLFERLRTRCPRGSEFGPWLQAQVAVWAEQYTGMR